MSDIVVSNSEIDDIRTFIQGRPSAEEFALNVMPRINAMIEAADTPELANGVRTIADMAKAYQKRAVASAIADRNKRLKKMYPVEEAYVKASGKAGLLVDPLRPGAGPGRGKEGTTPLFSEHGFQSRRDMTTCVRVGELIRDGELDTYFQHTKENGAHITVRGAENVWRMFYGKGSEKGKGLIEADSPITFGYWALPRPLTSGWGSGKMWQRISQEFGVPDVAFGVTDNIPSRALGVDIKTGYDWKALPFEDNQFGFGYWDPPYDHLYKHEGIEIWRTCRRLAILHTHIWPRAWLENAKRQAMVAVTMGPMKQIRCLQIFEKDLSQPRLFNG